MTIHAIKVICKEITVYISCVSDLLWDLVLHFLKCFLVNDRRVRIREYLQLVIAVVNDFLILVWRDLCAEINRITDIFTMLQNIPYHRCTPYTQIVSFHLDTFCHSSVICRSWYTLSFENTSNLIHTKGLIQIQVKDPANHISCRFIDQPCLLILWCIVIPIRKLWCNRLTAVAFLTYHGTNLFGNITAVPFVHQVMDRQQVVHSLGRIHVITDCNETNVMLWKFDFYILTDHEIVSAQTAHIFDDNSGNLFQESWFLRFPNEKQTIG